MNPLYNIPTTDPRVQSVIEYVKSLFLNKGKTVEVTCVDTPVFYLGSGWTTSTVTFSCGGKDYTCIAGLLLYYPQISITEMQSSGLL